MSKIIKVDENDLEIMVNPWEYLNRISDHLAVMLHASSMSADTTVISVENIRFLKSVLDDYLNHNKAKFSHVKLV
jgi:hypothetical protein